MPATDSHPADLLDLGSHCAECGQRDFLPFTCPDCGGRRTYCAEHRLAHAGCAGAGATGAARGGALPTTTSTPKTTTITCPLCTKQVDVQPHESPDEAHARHCRRQGECTPRERCARDGCKARPVATGRVRCSRCGALLCLAHRLPEDHACEGLAREKQRQERARRQQQQGGGSSAREFLNDAAAAARRAIGAAAATTTAAAAATTPSPRPRPPPPPPRTDPSNTVAGTAAVRARALALPELCPVCPRAQDVRFATVAELIVHCEAAHDGANGMAGARRRRRGGEEGVAAAAGDSKCVVC